jgi:hypothetical protein
MANVNIYNSMRTGISLQTYSAVNDVMDQVTSTGWQRATSRMLKSLSAPAQTRSTLRSGPIGSPLIRRVRSPA